MLANHVEMTTIKYRGFVKEAVKVFKISGALYCNDFFKVDQVDVIDARRLAKALVLNGLI